MDYSVTYKGDNLLNMSPCKKGTVLLILFLHISSSEFTILIDIFAFRESQIKNMIV